MHLQARCGHPYFGCRHIPLSLVGYSLSETGHLGCYSMWNPVLILPCWPPHLRFCLPDHLLTYVPNATPLWSPSTNAPEFFVRSKTSASASEFFSLWCCFGVSLLCWWSIWNLLPLRCWSSLPGVVSQGQSPGLQISLHCWLSSLDSQCTSRLFFLDCT